MTARAVALRGHAHVCPAVNPGPRPHVGGPVVSTQQSFVTVAPRNVIVYDTPSGMGGSFTVSIDRDIDAETVEVRVWYGRATPQGWERWRDWDGYVFTTRRDALTRERRMSLFKDG